MHWSNIISKFGTFPCREFNLVISWTLINFFFSLVYIWCQFARILLKHNYRTWLPCQSVTLKIMPHQLHGYLKSYNRWRRDLSFVSNTCNFPLGIICTNVPKNRRFSHGCVTHLYKFCAMMFVPNMHQMTSHSNKEN